LVVAAPSAEEEIMRVNTRRKSGAKEKKGKESEGKGEKGVWFKGGGM
jgi:hypothetical protein